MRSANAPGTIRRFSMIEPSRVTSLFFGSRVNTLSIINLYSYIPEGNGPTFASYRVSFFVIGIAYCKFGGQVPNTWTEFAPGAFTRKMTELSGRTSREI